MDLKPWPEGAIALICGRINDPYCRPTPGHKLTECWNCGAAVRIGVENQKLQSDPDLQTTVICVQCYAAYRDQTGRDMILIRPVVPQPNPEDN